MTSKDRYIVVGTHPWNHDIFNAQLKRYPGQWRYHDDPRTLQKAAQRYRPRYIFFLHWSHKVPSSLYDRFECVCFHMTHVPYGRGGSPLQNLIVRGHRSTQLTALRMVEGFDSGPVYLKRPLSLAGRAEEIYKRATELSVRMIRDILHSHPTPKPQSGRVTVFKRRTPAQSRIPRRASFSQLYDFLRMLDAPGYPHAYLTSGSYRYSFSHVFWQKDHLTATVTIKETEKSTL